jgi:hypothetical protein
MNMTMFGTLNGVPGYKVIFRAGDFGAPGKWLDDSFDTVREALFDPDDVPIYDTHDGDFEDR